MSDSAAPPSCLACGAVMIHLGGFSRCSRCWFTICEACELGIDPEVTEQPLGAPDTKTDAENDHS
jgi:hypothetical protein